MCTRKGMQQGMQLLHSSLVAHIGSVGPKSLLSQYIPCGTACVTIASIPGRLKKAAWYTLYAHACTLPPKKGIICVFVDTVSKINRIYYLYSDFTVRYIEVLCKDA